MYSANRGKGYTIRLPAGKSSYGRPEKSNADGRSDRPTDTKSVRTVVSQSGTKDYKIIMQAGFRKNRPIKSIMKLWQNRISWVWPAVRGGME